MRSALGAIPSVSNIQTNQSERTASFEIDRSYDIEGKLTELGESNEHIAGWSML
ncbi:MAG: hypothetical protein AAGF97_00685 [Planctomycetota bacterium]